MATKVLQDFLVAALVHVVAVDFKDTLTRLKTRSCCLRACIHTKMMPIMYNDLNQTNERCQTDDSEVRGLYILHVGKSKPV